MRQSLSYCVGRALGCEPLPMRVQGCRGRIGPRDLAEAQPPQEFPRLGGHLQKADGRAVRPVCRKVDRLERTRHHILERQAPSRAEYPKDIRIETFLVGDV